MTETTNTDPASERAREDRAYVQHLIKAVLEGLEHVSGATDRILHRFERRILADQASQVDGPWVHADDVVETTHPQFGQGYFCTPDAFREGKLYGP